MCHARAFTRSSACGAARHHRRRTNAHICIGTRAHLCRDSRGGPLARARLRLPVLLWQRMRRAATVGGALDAFSLVRARSEVESRLLADVSGGTDSPEWADGAGRRSRPAGSQLRSLNRGYLTPDREKPPWVLAPLHRWHCACSLGAGCVECRYAMNADAMSTFGALQSVCAGAAARRRQADGGSGCRCMRRRKLQQREQVRMGKPGTERPWRIAWPQRASRTEPQLSGTNEFHTCIIRPSARPPASLSSGLGIDACARLCRPPKDILSGHLPADARPSHLSTLHFHGEARGAHARTHARTHKLLHARARTDARTCKLLHARIFRTGARLHARTRAHRRERAPARTRTRTLGPPAPEGPCRVHVHGLCARCCSCAEA